MNDRQSVSSKSFIGLVFHPKTERPYPKTDLSRKNVVILGLFSFNLS